MSRPLLEFGGGSGDILRDLFHLYSVSETEALVSRAEGRDQLRHISMSLQAPEPLGRIRRPFGTERRCRHVALWAGGLRTDLRRMKGTAAENGV